MLQKRIFTALILIPLCVVLILALPLKHFAIVTGGIVFWAAMEWSNLLGLKSLLPKILYALIVTLLLPLTLYLYQHGESTFILFLRVFYWTVFFWWLFAALLVISYPKFSNYWGKGVLIRGLMGIMVLVPCWLSLVLLHYVTPYLVLSLFVLIWGADTGAYFAGKKWGKNKLLPQVSPGKTWQGLLGAVLTPIIIVVIFVIALRIPMMVFPYISFIVMIVLFSVLGDLFESMLKRQAGIKDSGKLLPGHGGILDRIDSLTAAAPIVTLYLLYMK